MIATSADAGVEPVPNVAVMPAGQPEDANVTVELNPLKGVTVTVDVPLLPWDAVAAVALKVKPGTPVTVSENVVYADDAPLIPLTANAYDPGATLGCTLIVSRDEVVAGFVPKVPVIPAGQPTVARVTEELKPLAGVTVTVDVPPPPVDAAAPPALSVKFSEGAVTVSAIEVLADNAPLVPFTVSA